MKNCFLVIMLLMAGCEAYEASKYKQDMVDKMRWLETADPGVDVENTIQRNDFRFIGINGYSISTPGVDINYPGRENIDPTDETSDVIGVDEHLRLVKLADKYAEAYNKKLLPYQENHFDWSCQGERVSDGKAST